MTREIVVADIGGTHARFALAEIARDGGIALDEAVTLTCAEYAGFEEAWATFADHAGRELPDAAALALATHVDGDVVTLTNNPWVIDRQRIMAELGLDECLMLNDFAAVAHAVATLRADSFAHFCGPDRALPEDGAISVVGPGTGLGVGLLVRWEGGYRVIETEGGHIEFAPLDAVEEAIRDGLRAEHERVSVERVVSGPGLATIYATLAELENEPIRPVLDALLWAAAISGEDELAARAFERFCLCLGSVAGDIALAQGADAVVIAGGLGARIAGSVPLEEFHARFTAKGRFEDLMERLPIKLLVHEQPGLHGAAAAFARKAA